MSESSDAEKTEAPTPHKLEKARKDGQLPRSKELTSVMMLVAGCALMLLGGERMARHLLQLLHHGLEFNTMMLEDPYSMVRKLHLLFSIALTSLLPFVLGLFVVGATTPMLLGGLHLSGKSLGVKLSRLSPLAGLKRMFSAQLVSELLKSLLKVTLIGCASALYILAHWENMIQLLYQSYPVAIGDACELILYCLLLVTLALIPMVGYDVLYQIFSHIKKLRMTRQEIRDEFKEQEGNPQIKGRIKQMQRAAARGRMMADVPNADVIVNNPTHYSVALSYKEGDMSAPVLLAKGTREVASRIREVAQAHNIPMLEAPPLARALYRHCEIGETIPASLYTAVAEVLAWVYGLRRWRKSGGMIPKKPENLPVPAALDFNPESHN